MYKGASENSQSRVSRIRLADLANGEEIQSTEDQYNNLKAAIHNLNQRLPGIKDPAERSKLIAEKLEWEKQVRELRAKTIGLRHEQIGMAQVFIDVAKEMLMPAQFKMIMGIAQRRFKEQREAHTTR